MLFTKVYKEEDVRLRGCSYNVASIYFHLKNKRDYFKNKNNGTRKAPQKSSNGTVDLGF